MTGERRSGKGFKAPSINDAAQAIAPVDLPTGLVGTPDRPLPAFARLDSRLVVVMELAEYRELLAAASRNVQIAAALPSRAPRATPVGLSTIERDPEVADFLRDRFPRSETLATIHAACVERFGQDRTPSSSRISTFRVRWKRHR